MRRITTVIAIIIVLSMLFIAYNLYYKPKVIERNISNKLEDINLLTTGENIYKEVIYSKTTSDIFWIPVKNKEFLLSINYHIVTGIDLNKGYNIAHNGSYIEVTVPYPEIVQIDADDLSIKEYFTKERFSDIKRDDYFSIINETKNELSQSQEVQELLLESKNSAELTIKSLLGIVGKPIKVKFK